MHYLTNYYKDLCEQLKEKLNILEAELGRVQAKSEREKEEIEDAAMNPSYSPTPEPKSDLIKITPRPLEVKKRIKSPTPMPPKPRGNE